MPDSQRYPEKLCLQKYELDIHVFCLLKQFLIFVVSLQRDFISCLQEIMEKK